jgi:hypothetical protein
MTEQPKKSPIDEAWERHFIDMCKDGCDPAAAADGMLRIAMLRVEHLRGSRLAAATLATAAGFFAQRAAIDRTANDDRGPVH